MLEEFLLALVSLWLIIAAAVYGPTSASCPATWHHDGIRPTGSFQCVRGPVGDPDWDGTWMRPERGVVPPGVLRARIYCTNGTEPIVVNERTVGCQRFSR